PKELSRANGTLLYDVNNRGGKVSLGMFNGGADGFLMRKGYVVVASGWIAEVLPGGGRLRLEAPVATERGRPITGLVRAEMVPDAPAERLSIAHWGNQGSYAPTERGLREATLTWRQRESDPRVAIPRAQWRLDVRPVPGSAYSQVDMLLSGGFRPGYIYELVYEAQGPVVQGLGLAGIRDLVSFLKHGSAGNPLLRPDGKPAALRAIGFGVSQSGRCLRQFLYDGFNADEQGRPVFEGLFPHVAGAGMGFFNHRFASPTRHSAQHDHHLDPVDAFPFTYGDEKDPFTGRTDGILRRARAAGTVPKIFHVNTGAEYWHRAASLVHTDPLGRRDVDIPAE
ncbi:MAG TPA: alpha/beta hydrolase domain-containing protein, partial [Armatimonadota bacterium]|nr:alpha/beta hydrolase domain-containing protein [Armatimonadota bacterium]